MNWIDVKQRLPEKTGRYLAIELWNWEGKIDQEVSVVYFDKAWEILVDTDDEYHKKRAGVPQFISCNEVTHWMEIPEIPKPDSTTPEPHNQS